jgi:hypothetical protein
MNFAGLKKLEGKQVNLWPTVLVLPDLRPTPMPWSVWRVDAKERVVEILAPSGHRLDVVDVIHHYQKTGNMLILDAQLVICGHEVKVSLARGARPSGRCMRRSLTVSSARRCAVIGRVASVICRFPYGRARSPRVARQRE